MNVLLFYKLCNSSHIGALMEGKLFTLLHVSGAVAHPAPPQMTPLPSTSRSWISAVLLYECSIP